MGKPPQFKQTDGCDALLSFTEAAGELEKDIEDSANQGVPPCYLGDVKKIGNNIFSVFA